MKKIANKKNYNREILNGKGLQIVRFCAEWSGPCQIMGPIYEEIEIMYKGAALFYRIDVDEMPLLTKELGVKELPTILFYKNGIAIDFVIGLVSRNVLTEKMEKVLNNYRSE